MRLLRNKIGDFYIRHKELTQAIIVFLLPVLVFIVSTGLFTGVNEVFVRGLHIEVVTATDLSRMIAEGGAIGRGLAIREVLANYIDPAFFISMLTGRSLGFGVLLTGHLIKIGLSALSVYYLLIRTIGVEHKAAFVLSTSYSLFPALLLYGQIVSLQNFAVILPITILFVDGYIKNSNLSSFIKMTALEVLLFISGAYGTWTGAIAVFMFAILLIICREGSLRSFLSGIGGIVISMLTALAASAIIIIPRFSQSSLQTIDESFISRFSFIDMLSSMLDGKYPSTIFDTGLVPLTLGIFTLYMLILFFINSVIPYRIKIFYLITFILLYVTFAFPAIDSAIDLFIGTALTASRYILLALLILFAVALSYKNLASVTKGQINLTSALMLGIVVFSNSSAFDTSPSMFTLFFSIAMILAVTFTLSSEIKTGIYRRNLLCLLAVFATVINMIVVSPKAICGYNEMLGYDSGLMTTDDMHYDIKNADVPLFTSLDYSYCVLSSDISGCKVASLPEAVNSISRSALLDDVYLREEGELIYIQGLIASSDLYTVENTESQCEVVIRADLFLRDDIYLYSGLKSKVYLTESDAVTDHLVVYDAPFIHKVESTEDYVNLRVATTPDSAGIVEISLWSLDEEANDSFRSIIYNFDGREIKGGDYRWILANGDIKSIVTSVPYSDSLKVTVGGRRAEAFDYCGLLGVSFPVNGTGIMPNIKISINNNDIFAGLVITLLSMTIVTVTYIVNTKRNTKEISE